MNFQKYRHDDWISYFSGDRWALLGFSSWIRIYTRPHLWLDVDSFVRQAIVVWDGVVTTAYIRESERAFFGKKVAEEVMKRPEVIHEMVGDFVKHTDEILSFYDRAIGIDISLDQYLSYVDLLTEQYYPFHLKIKNVIDFLPLELKDFYLPVLQEARIHAEPIFSREIDFIHSLSDVHAKKTGYAVEHIQSLLANEFLSYWKDGSSLPDEHTLADRYKSFAVSFGDGEVQHLVVGKDVEDVLSVLYPMKFVDGTLHGQSAYAGFVVGTVRVVYDPSQVVEFHEGDILVAPWTRPEYLPLMKKAGAFVTDGGGLLSHAAIMAREMKKPCVIGTGRATKVFHDGDTVEVDAEKGIVRKI